MTPDDSALLQKKLTRLRIALTVGFCWFVFVIILPDSIRDALQYPAHALHPEIDVVSVVLLIGLTSYMMIQIATLTRVILPVIGGIVLMAISEVSRLAGIEPASRQFFSPRWSHALNIVLNNLVNDIGLTLFISGLLYAIIELLLARDIAQHKNRQLAHEMAERRRVEAEVESQRLCMVRASRMSSLGAMASGLGHEIKNPLAVISGTLQQLEDLLPANTPNRERISKTVAVVQRNVERIDRIVRGLRRLARDEQARQAVSNVPLKTIVLDTLELCQERFRADGIALEVSEMPESIQSECRPVEISQVLLNLLNNAHDAVTQATDARTGLDDKWVRIEAADRGQDVELAVVDSGPGVPADVREKIFDAFFTTKPPGEGIGVGLSISRQIMDAHEGVLFLDPASNNTRFVIRIPRIQTTPRPSSKY